MVSVTVSVLEKAGLNVKGRWVTLAARDRLEEAACECYKVIRKTYEQVGTREPAGRDRFCKPPPARNLHTRAAIEEIEGQHSHLVAETGEIITTN